jgi:hypothetical protein
LLFNSCSSDTPQKFFEVAVLNTNKLVGFAGNGFQRQLESPSAKLLDNGNETATMTRKEVVNSQIEFAEDNLMKIEKMNETPDNKDILSSSIAIYKFVIPVYKSEYMQLAELYDNGASDDQIQSLAKSIHDRYNPEYEKLYNKVIENGKIYADKHSIKVNW